MFKVESEKEYQSIVRRYSGFEIKFVRVTDSEATLRLIKR